MIEKIFNSCVELAYIHQIHPHHCLHFTLQRYLFVSHHCFVPLILPRSSLDRHCTPALNFPIDASNLFAELSTHRPLKVLCFETKQIYSNIAIKKSSVYLEGYCLCFAIASIEIDSYSRSKSSEFKT